MNESFSMSTKRLPSYCHHSVIAIIVRLPSYCQKTLTCMVDIMFRRPVSGTTCPRSVEQGSSSTDPDMPAMSHDEADPDPVFPANAPRLMPTIAEFADGHHVTHLYRMIDDDDGTDLKFLNMDKAMSHMPSTPQAPVDSSSFEVNDSAFEHVDPVSVANLGQWLNLSYAADMEQVSSSSSSSRVEQVSEGQRCDEHMTVQREDIEALRQSKTFGGSTGYEPHT